MKTYRRLSWPILTAIVVALTLPVSVTVAQGRGHSGGGGGGSGAAYSIVELPSPNGDTDHYSVVKNISDVGLTGKVHVTGYHFYSSDEDRPYVWTMDAGGSFRIEDLSPWFWERTDLDVNSAGVICGGTSLLFGNQSPAVLFPDGKFVVLQAGFSRVRLNNPDPQGNFQVVGYHVLWDIAADGKILATTPLVDANETLLYAYDINDSHEIAGVVYVDNDRSKQQIPVVGWFVGGQLQLSPLTNPDPKVIVAFADMQIDHAGNLLGDGFTPSANIPGAISGRAVVWPASGGSFSLVNEFNNMNVAYGNGIATVNGFMQVVGTAYANSGGYPFLYMKGAVSDLNQLAESDEPWDIQGAEAINSAGMICSHGAIGTRRNRRAGTCLLIPAN